MWRAVLLCGWRSKTWLMASLITSESGPKRSLMGRRWRPTSLLGLEKVGPSLVSVVSNNVYSHGASFSNHLPFFFFIRSPRPSWRTLYFSVRHCTHTALDQRWSRSCTHHTIRHRGKTLWWATFINCVSYLMTTALIVNTITSFRHLAFRWRIVGYPHQRHS